jgi:alkanesulfonate monooxygenase SsuD/methylene tetrahydromethanopterin reductase-like flavin-dependent oxidoreductase (luciferase family)
VKIGLMLPLGADESGRYTDLRALALEAEASGLDSVWGADHLIYRENGEDDGDPEIPENAIRGSTQEIADALAGYAVLGISHLITHLWPRTPSAVARFGEAAALARSGS